ncbi:MAG: DNA replication/repair protein RecF [Oscillospiraceae bacterium]
MVVKKITIKGFRNYELSEADFSEGVNILLGKNGQGKTNLLEAIFYLTSGRSFKTRYDRETINFNRENAAIESLICSDGREQKLSVKLSRLQKKELWANGVRMRTTSDFAGRLTAVMFSPEDLYMIKEGAAARRRLMDMCISQLRPRYVSLLTEYNRIYENKTRILRDWRVKPALLDTLDDFSRQLALRGAELIHYRAHFSKKLSRAAGEIHRDFSGGAEQLDIIYRTVKTVSDPLAKPSEIFPRLLEHQEAHRRAEIESGLCLSGAHKDDLEILINGSPARSFASQGQTRTAALSIKLAERRIHFEDRGEYPVLLLDDVLSELDCMRRDFVINHISNGQVFITCCEDVGNLGKTGAKFLHIDCGSIV